MGVLTRETKYRRHYDAGQIKYGFFFNNFSTNMLTKNSSFHACTFQLPIVDNLLTKSAFCETAFSPHPQHNPIGADCTYAAVCK
jgi:hypothetical protein